MRAWKRGIGASATPSTTINKTTNYTVVAGDNGNVISNVGAVGIVIITLPPATGSSTPFRIKGRVSAAFTLRFLAVGSDVISYGSLVGNAGGYIESSSPGAFLELLNDESGKWLALSYGPTNWGVSQ